MEVDHEEWTEYSLRGAPAALLCVFWRGGLDRPRVGYAKDFPADLNAAGLWWKLTGIARMELDAMPPEQREQVLGSTPSYLERILSGSFVGAAAATYDGLTLTPLGLIPKSYIHH